MPAKLSDQEASRRREIGAQIRYYRQTAGFSLDELARQVNDACEGGAKYDRRHAMKWEIGEAPLSDALINIIARILGANTWFVEVATSPQIPSRSRLIHGSADRNLTHELSRQLCAITGYEIRSWINFTYRAKRGYKFRHPFVFHDVDINADVVEKIAGKIRENWDLGLAPVADVVQILEDNCVVFVQRDGDVVDVRDSVVYSGMLAGWPGVCWWGPQPKTPSESGHFRERVLSAALRAIALRDVPLAAASNQAHRVAAALLLPRFGMSRYLGGICNSVTVDNVRALAGRYGLPIRQVIERLVETGIVRDSEGQGLRRAIATAEPIVCQDCSIRELLLPGAAREMLRAQHAH